MQIEKNAKKLLGAELCELSVVLCELSDEESSKVCGGAADEGIIQLDINNPLDRFYVVKKVKDGGIDRLTKVEKDIYYSIVPIFRYSG